MTPIRIFIASPQDVADERIRAHGVIERLREEFADRTDLQSVIWEHEPLLATADFQSQIGTPATSDIFVLILWSRIGSPLGREFVRPDGSRYSSATEYEFEEAITSYRDTGSPKVLAYRKSVTGVPASDDAGKQQAAVDAFFAKWFQGEDDVATGAYHTFSEASRFERVLELHLRKTLLGYLPSPSNLPLPANTFVGREKSSERLVEMLTTSSTRLVVLVGPGGAGKTRLSQYVGRKLLPGFRDGVFFVSLASVTEPDVVPTAIAETIGVRDPGGLDIHDVVRHLKRREVLLILDNLEQVQSAGRYVRAILDECEAVRCIVTSREALRLSGAHTFQVLPLAVPAEGRLPPIDELQEVEAVRLFVDRASAAKEDFQLSLENAADVVDIIRRVDALPLAIELAASRIRTMSPRRLSEALRQRFRVLTGGPDDLLAHQRSLRELIAWSYELLEEPEQRLWRRLSVFADGCPVDVAQTVCDPEDEYLLEVDVEALVDKSLVRLDADSNAPRIGMLESLREFAWEELCKSSELESINARFSTWCAGIGQGSYDGVPEAAVGQLEREQNNLRAALERHIVAGRADDALGLCFALRHYWFTRGLAAEGIQWIGRALALSREETINRSRALFCLVTLERSCGDAEAAIQHAELALEVSSRLGDEATRAAVLCERGALAAGQGDLETATAMLSECVSVASDAEVSEDRMSHFLIVQGVVEHLKGDLEGARNLYLSALEKAGHAGSKTGTSNALMNLAEISEAEGAYEEAYAQYRESLELSVELQHMHGMASCAEMIAGLELGARNRPYESALLLGACASVREEIGEPVAAFNMKTIEGNIAGCRDALGEAVFREAWDTGHGLGVKAIQRALASD